METLATTEGKVLYTAHTHTTGGREHGVARSNDGHLEVTLSLPGTEGKGTNPEQLFAAGWSACFEGAMMIEARKRRITLAEDTAIDAEVDLCFGESGYFLRARLNVSLPGLDQPTKEALVEAGKKGCPYSKAIKGNIEVEYNII